MFSISQEILETKLQGKDWDWEDFEAVVELMEEGYDDEETSKPRLLL